MSLLLKTLQLYKTLTDQDFEPLKKAPLVFDADSHPEHKPFVEVWRMQNAKGEGPYKGDSGEWRSEPHMAATGRPGPWDDEGFNEGELVAGGFDGSLNTGKFPFAFETEEHMNKWFKPEEMEKLTNLGFKPTKVKAKRVWSSGKQAFYEPYEEPEEQKLASSEKLFKIAKDDTSEVASIAVRNGTALLMGKRRDNERWTLPGGHLDKGEDKFEGAVRELFEEAGIKVDKKDLKHLGSEDVTTYTGKKKRIHAFTYEYDGERPTTKNDPDKEVYKWEWIECEDGLPEDIEENLHSPKNKVLQELGLLKKSEKLIKAPLSTDVTEAHDDWTGNNILQSDRERLHTLMHDPKHAKERGAMLRGLAMKVPTKELNGERHYLLHRRHGPIEGNTVTHPKTTSYSTHPKEKMNKILSGGNIHSAWIPESKISYSYEFSLPHHQTEPEYSHGHEGEVIVGRGTYPVHDKFYQTDSMKEPIPGHKIDKLAASEVYKSDYGPKGAGLYNPADNARRKETRTGEVAGTGPNKEVRYAGPTANQQASAAASHWKKQSKKNPVKVYTREEIAQLKSGLESRSNKLKANEPQMENIGHPVPPPPPWHSSYHLHRQALNSDSPPVKKDPLDALHEKMLHEGRLIYHPKKGYLLSRRIQHHGDSVPLMRSERGPIRLEHYSQTPGLTTIDPVFQGSSHVSSQEYKRGLPQVPMSYFYRRGTEPEDIVRQGSKSKYHVTLEPHQKIYDLAQDPDKLVSSALEENGGAWNRDMILGKIKDAGYHGMHNSSSSLPNVVGIFHPVKPHKEEGL